jgi:hypothetical protein
MDVTARVVSPRVDEIGKEQEFIRNRSVQLKTKVSDFDLSKSTFNSTCYVKGMNFQYSSSLK